MTLMSRSPTRLICSVRGIGVALIEITSTFSRLAQELLLLDAEALLLVDDQQPEVLAAHVAAEHAMGADQDVDLALRSAWSSRCSAGGPKRLTCSMMNGWSRRRSVKVP